MPGLAPAPATDPSVPLVWFGVYRAPAAVAARERFFTRARNEERFAAEHALLLADDPSAAQSLSRSALAAAVALRALHLCAQIVE